MGPGQAGVRGSLEVPSAAKDALDADISDEVIHFSYLKPPLNQ